MELESIWGFITLIGLVLSIKYRSSFKQFMGPADRLYRRFVDCLYLWIGRCLEMMKINLLKEELDDFWDEANARFHHRFQLWCLIGIVLIIVLGFIYR